MIFTGLLYAKNIQLIENGLAHIYNRNFIGLV